MPMIPTRAARRSIFSSRAFLVTLSPVEGGNSVDNLVQLRARQFGKHWEGDDFLRSALGLGKGAFLVPEVRKARLEMQRQRVVNRCADLPRCQVLLELIAVLGTNGVLIEYRNIFWIDERRHDLRDVRERLVVVLRIGAALLAPALEMAQLGAQDRGLQRVETAVVTHFVVEVGLQAAVYA